MNDSSIDMMEGDDELLLDCSNSDSHYQSEGDESMMTGLSFEEINSNYSDDQCELDESSSVPVESLIILHPSWLTRVMDIATNRDCIKAFLDKRYSTPPVSYERKAKHDRYFCAPHSLLSISLVGRLGSPSSG